MRKRAKYLPMLWVFLIILVMGSLQANASKKDEIYYTYEWHNPIYDQSAVKNENAVQKANAGTTFSLKRANYTSSYEEAGEMLRENMINRVEQTTIYFEVPGLTATEITDEYLDTMCSDIYATALLHTGNPKEGDSLQYAITYYQTELEATCNEVGAYFTINYYVYYFTVLEQEILLDEAVNELLSQLNLNDKSDFDKIKTIYDYMVANIEYDYEGLAQNVLDIYTAYAALIEKSAVCQGYAALFYRLALECGIDNRMIIGYSHGESHAWNIVELDGYYYYLDATWDSTADQDKKHHEYFLKGKNDFSDHTPLDIFISEEFLEIYPISDENYSYSDDPDKICVEGNYSYVVDDNEAKIYKYSGIEADLVIPSELGGYKVTVIGCNAFSDNDFIQRVSIPSSVIEIENAVDQSQGDGIDDGAFYHCDSLVEVQIPLDSELKIIGLNSFSYCERLSTINLPNSIKILEENAFNYCTALENINLPEGLEKIGQNAFAFSKIESLYIPSTCTYVSTFQKIPSLKEIIVAEGNEYYRSFGGALYVDHEYHGWMLTIYPESKVDEYYVVADYAKYILTDAFLAVDVYTSGNEPNLKKLNIANCNSIDIVGNVSLSRIRCEIEVPHSNPYFKNMDGMVVSKDGTELMQVPSNREGTLIIPDGILTIGEYACELANITEVVIPDSVKEVGVAAFWNCYNLEKVKLSKQMTEIPGSVFQNCYALHDIVIPSNITKICTNAFLDCHSLEEIILPESITIIEDQVFNGCRSLKSITIPNGVKKLGTGTHGGVLANCWALEEVILPEGLEDLGFQAFHDCFSLKSIVLPESITQLPVNLFGYSGLEKITLSNNIELIGSLAFSCTPLKAIYIPSSVKYIEENAFENCRDLQIICYEGTEEEWNKIVVFGGNEVLSTSLIEYSSDGIQDSVECTEGFYTFIKTGSEAKITKYAGNEIDLVIPSELGGVKVTSIGHSAFINNSFIEKITFPNSIKKIEGDFSEGAFAECINLREVVIPVDSELSSIGRHCFYNCGNLSKITLPNSIRLIEMEAFTYCSSLQNMNLPEGLEQVEQCVFAFSSIRTLCIPSTCYYFDPSQSMLLLEEVTVAEGNEKYRSHEGVLYQDMDYKGWTLILYPESKSGETYTVADYAKWINCDTFGSQFLYRDNNDPELKVLNIGNCNGFDGAGNVSFSKICCEIIVPTTNPYYMNYDGMVLSKDGTVFVQVPRNREGKIIIPESITTISSYAFESSNVSEVIMPDSVCVIGEGIFENCRKLQKVHLSNQLDEIKVAMFRDCQMLSSIVLPSNIKKIGVCAFYGCYSLKKISFPCSLEMIDVTAFDFCNSIETIYYEGTQDEWNNIQIAEYNDILHQAEVVYSADMEETKSIAGDANGDGEIDTKDVTVIRRFIVGGYGISIDELASDVNDDGVVDTKDVTMIRRFIVGGYGVTLS